MGVTIEGAGKDHTSAGGSRDMANTICQKIFQIKQPFDIPYEWILLRGSKMSSSKGVGTSAREFTALFPDTVGRFLFINKHYSQVIDFDPSTMAIPDLFDDYDQAARIYWGLEDGDQRLGRAFVLSQIKEVPKPHFLARFRDLALWVQYPEKDVFEEASKVKGSGLTDLEKLVIKERLNYVELWLAKYAPEEFQWRAKKEMPARAKELSGEQRIFLQELNELLDERSDWQAQDLQQAIFELAKNGIGAKQGFSAIYLAFLGKNSGPRAAWFLLDLDPKFRLQRIKELNYE
jgi:lysyl-tRNA synthetase class 1